VLAERLEVLHLKVVRAAHARPRLRRNFRVQQDRPVLLRPQRRRDGRVDAAVVEDDREVFCHPCLAAASTRRDSVHP
jgi:hypothetical protein